MKKLFYVLCLLTLSMVTSCSSYDDYDCEESSYKSLPDLVGEIVENNNPEDGLVYVSYTSSTGAKVIMSTRGDGLDSGWIYGGHASGRVAAVTLATKLAINCNLLEMNRKELTKINNDFSFCLHLQTNTRTI